MDDNGLDWEWTRTEFRKALLDCANATNDSDLELLRELHACSLLMLNFRHRLSLKQQKALSDLAAVGDVDEYDLGMDPEDPEADDELIRCWLEDAIKHAQRCKPLFEGI